MDDYKLYDVVEMKRPHPCKGRTKRFQIVMVGSDVKIRCLGCGAYIMMPRYFFNQKIRKVIDRPNHLIDLSLEKMAE